MVGLKCVLVPSDGEIMKTAETFSVAPSPGVCARETMRVYRSNILLKYPQWL